jgi:hypothetical protein
MINYFHKCLHFGSKIWQALLYGSFVNLALFKEPLTDPKKLLQNKFIYIGARKFIYIEQGRPTQVVSGSPPQFYFFSIIWTTLQKLTGKLVKMSLIL